MKNNGRDEIKKIKIIIVDISPLMRKALKRHIETQYDMEVIGETDNERELIGLLTNTDPDIVIMDIEIPGLAGFETIVRIIKTSPGTRVLVFTNSDDTTYIINIIKAGASGYLMKRVSVDVLIHLIRKITAGEKIFPPAIIEYESNVIDNKNTYIKDSTLLLSKREIDVLKLIAGGFQNRCIADKLNLSLPYVKILIKTAYLKLGASSRVSAISLGIKKGVISVGDLMNV